MSQPDQQHKLLPQPGPWCREAARPAAASRAAAALLRPSSAATSAPPSAARPRPGSRGGARLRETVPAAAAAAAAAAALPAPPGNGNKSPVKRRPGRAGRPGGGGGGGGSAREHTRLLLCVRPNHRDRLRRLARYSPPRDRPARPPPAPPSYIRGPASAAFDVRPRGRPRRGDPRSTSPRRGGRGPRPLPPRPAPQRASRGRAAPPASPGVCPQGKWRPSAPSKWTRRAAAPARSFRRLRAPRLPPSRTVLRAGEAGGDARPGLRRRLPGPLGQAGDFAPRGGEARSARRDAERPGICFCACTEHTCSETLSLTKAGICASQCCSPEACRHGTNRAARRRPTWPCSDGGAWHRPPLGARGHVILPSDHMASVTIYRFSAVWSSAWTH
ncbi:uncharacterized protein [Canis lupus baileyi]|uniref:uncharacterized protein n=1 Tax=Canis lupus baileyi TaxID=143281 RepID=UPI003B973583